MMRFVIVAFIGVVVFSVVYLSATIWLNKNKQKLAPYVETPPKKDDVQQEQSKESK